jgi:glycosyltransferase involved in cell wall biosynthesis
MRKQPKPSYVIAVPWRLDHGGGVNEVVSNLYRETLAADELQPLVMVAEWSAIRPTETVSDTRRTVYFRFWAPWSEDGSIMSLLKWFVAAPFYLAGLVRFCRSHRVVAFNFQYSSLNAFPVALLRFLRLYRGGLILSFQGLDLATARKSGLIQRVLWRFVLNWATNIVACSRSFAADVQTFVGEDGPRVYAIHNGVDIDYMISTCGRGTSLPKGLGTRRFIVSVATFEQKKGLDVLLRAFGKVRDANPGLALVLVGRSSDAEMELRDLAESLALKNDVFFCANVPHADVAVFLKHASGFCLPSRAEPFGIALLEAGVYRLPVVATRVGGIPEFIINGESGILVPPEDPEALAAALNLILADRPLARSLGERLYRIAAEDMSWKRAYQAYRGLLTNDVVCQ